MRIACIAAASLGAQAIEHPHALMRSAHSGPEISAVVNSDGSISRTSASRAGSRSSLPVLPVGASEERESAIDVALPRNAVEPFGFQPLPSASSRGHIPATTEWWRKSWGIHDSAAATSMLTQIAATAATHLSGLKAANPKQVGIGLGAVALLILIVVQRTWAIRRSNSEEEGLLPTDANRSGERRGSYRSRRAKAEAAPLPSLPSSGGDYRSRRRGKPQTPDSAGSEPQIVDDAPPPVEGEPRQV